MGWLLGPLLGGVLGGIVVVRILEFFLGGVSSGGMNVIRPIVFMLGGGSWLWRVATNRARRNAPAAAEAVAKKATKAV